MIRLPYILLCEIAIVAIILRIVSIIRAQKGTVFSCLKRESVPILLTLIVCGAVLWGWHTLVNTCFQRPTIGFLTTVTLGVAIYNLLKAVLITAFGVLTYMSIKDKVRNKWSLNAVLIDIKTFIQLMLKPFSVVIFVISLYLCSINIIC